MSRLKELCQKFPEIPRSIVIKTDVLREGIKKTPVLGEIAKWAMHDPHWLFDWDHDDVHTKEEADAQGEFVPELFQLDDDTAVKIILDMKSPYEIIEKNGGFCLERDGTEVAEISFPKKPKWYAKKTRDGLPVTAVAALKGIDCFASCIFSHCEYFRTGEECRYCCLNYNVDHQRELGVEKKIGKTAEQIGDAAAEAFKEGNIRHVTFSGGALLNRSKEADLYIKVLEEVRRRTGHENDVLWGDVVCQALEPADAERLKKAGIQSVCWNLEVWDARLFEMVVPGKARYVGRDNWLRCLQEAVGIFGRGNVCSSFVSGAEMAQPEGFKTVDEALESTLGGFEWLLQHGIVPRYNMWSNVTGSDYAEKEIPPTEYWLRLGQGRHNLMLKHDMYPHATCNCFKDAHRSTVLDFYHLMT